jgi:penicillin-binding protein 1A
MLPSSIYPCPARHRRLRRWVLWSAACLAASIVALGVAGAIYLSSLPGVGDAEARVRAILAAHGGIPGLGPPPARLGRAVVAVEDENFYSNVAVDIADGGGRAALALLQRGGDPGGSTIGQQLAKSLYPHGGGLGGTLEEIGLAVELSLHYSKDRILSMYLNSVYYGNGYWGDVAAARGYFGVSPSRLSWSQASLLAGLPQAPSAYDPERHSQLARRRQLHVLDQLVDNGVLSQAGANAALREPWRLRRSAPATSRRKS